MECPKCGMENPEAGRFCASCGSPLVVSVRLGSTRGIEARLAKFFSASPKLLRLLPFSSKISGLLDLDLIRTINPIVLFVPVAFTFLLGLSPSAFGHIENSPFLFQALPIISVFNPFLGYLSAIAFAVGDIIQKLFYDDVYYGGSATIVDYVGARIGFIISYSSVVTFGLLPGVLARVFRNFMTRRQMQGRPLDGGTATTIASIIPFVLGGAIGAAISGVAAIGLEMPSFYMRQSPDVSCANVMINTNIQNTIPTSTASGLVGGVVGPIANSTIPKIVPPTTGQDGQSLRPTPGQQPAKPASPSALEKADKALKEAEKARKELKKQLEKAKKFTDVTPEKAKKFLEGVEKATKLANKLGPIREAVDFWNKVEKKTKELKKRYGDKISAEQARNAAIWEEGAKKYGTEKIKEKIKQAGDTAKKAARELEKLGVVSPKAARAVDEFADTAGEAVDETGDMAVKARDWVFDPSTKPQYKAMDDIFGPESKGGGHPVDAKWDVMRDEWMSPTMVDGKRVYKVPTGDKRSPYGPPPKKR